jgi:L-iditol 2-dehydrogenase
MKALVFEGSWKIRLKDVPAPQIGQGELLLAPEACGLCGSDIVKFPADPAGRHVPIGHEVAGRVAQVGPGVKKFKKGDRVVVAHHVPCLECHFCRKGNFSMCREFKQTNLDPGGFAQFVRVSSRHVEHATFKLPAKVGYLHATMVESLSCCLRLERRIGLQKGDTAVIVGLGFIGVLTTQLLRMRGVQVIGVDIDPNRVRLAQKLGLEHAYTGKEGRMEQILLSLTQNRGADAMISTAGTAALIPQRLGWVRDGGVINIFGSFPSPSEALVDLNAIYHRELTMNSSYSPAPEDLREAHRMLCSGEFDVSPFARNTFPLDRFDEALRQVLGREILKAILLPQRLTAEASRNEK